MKDKSNKRKNIAMVVFSHYPEDPRVRREAEALEESGYLVDVFCLKKLNQKSKEKIGNVTVYRSSLKRSRTGKMKYIIEYLLFIISMIFEVAFKFIVRRYKIIHIHNMPDILVIIALFPKLFGAKVILDMHDPTPEVYMSKYEMGEKHKMIKILIAMEKISIKIADIVLTPNIAFKELFISRGSPENKIKIVMNSPNESIFFTDNQNALSKKPNLTNFSIIYHGSIVERHGLYDALLAIKMLRKKIPNIIFNIYGDGDYVDKLVEEINKLELSDTVFFHGYLQQEKLVEIIQMADLGIIPNRRSPFTEVNLPTRILEYLCLSKLVIVPSTKGIRDYFDKDSLLFFNSGDPNDLADVIYQVYSRSTLCIEKLKKGMEVYKKYTWASQKKSLIYIVSDLIEKKSKKL